MSPIPTSYLPAVMARMRGGRRLADWGSAGAVKAAVFPPLHEAPIAVAN